MCVGGDLRRVPRVVAPAKERRAERIAVHAHDVTIFDCTKQLRGACKTAQREEGALLVGRVEEVSCVGEAPDAGGGRQHSAHSVDVEEDGKAAGAAAAYDNFGGGVKAVSAGDIVMLIATGIGLYG
jgi:hypothetical protein